MESCDSLLAQRLENIGCPVSVSSGTGWKTWIYDWLVTKYATTRNIDEQAIRALFDTVGECDEEYIST